MMQSQNCHDEVPELIRPTDNESEFHSVPHNRPAGTPPPSATVYRASERRPALQRRSHRPANWTLAPMERDRTSLCTARGCLVEAKCWDVFLPLVPSSANLPVASIAPCRMHRIVRIQNIHRWLPAANPS